MKLLLFFWKLGCCTVRVLQMRVSVSAVFVKWEVGEKRVAI